MGTAGDERTQRSSRRAEFVREAQSRLAAQGLECDCQYRHVGMSQQERRGDAPASDSDIVCARSVKEGNQKNQVCDLVEENARDAEDVKFWSC